MRFFDTNQLYTIFGNTINESSGTGSFAFDENTKFGWKSDGQDTDGDSAYIENIILDPQLIDRIFLRQTNISNFLIEVDVGAGYVTLAPDEVQTSSDSETYLYILNTPINLEKIKISGSNTIIANQEKRVKQVYAFNELGRIEDFNNISPTRERVQKITKLQAGKVDVIEFGRHFSFKIDLKAHYKEIDNEIIDTLARRDVPMFVWINDNTESIMKMYQEPFRFQDLYKVSIEKKDKIKFTNNLYFSGLDNNINMIEVY